jgi:catechol 2,3-dioxygenase-like lactoylglutathione lyase family enzyme
MATTQTAADATDRTAAAVPLRFEVTVIPVADVDRAKAFYSGLDWRLDADFAIDAGFRIVQFTPPGSPASIQFGTGMTTLAPGSMKDMYLVVDDIEAARGDLIAHGAPVSEIWHGRGPGGEGHQPGPDPDRSTYSSFASFSDPDGNRWLLQEITQRLPGRGLALDVASLAELLREAEEHHGAYEPVAPPHHWSDWYSPYIVARRDGSTPDEAAAAATTYMAEVKGVVVPS